MSDYVYGLNKSGLSVIKLLHNQKKNFDCWDDNKKIRLLVNKNIPKLNFKKINKITRKESADLTFIPESEPFLVRSFTMKSDGNIVKKETYEKFKQVILCVFKH